MENQENILYDGNNHSFSNGNNHNMDLSEKLKSFNENIINLRKEEKNFTELNKGMADGLKELK